MLQFVPLLLALALSPTQQSWRSDPIWYDGQAEVAVYECEREVYGAPRHYQASVYTNKENVDPRTSCKSAGEKGLEVFKHHWRERIPTPNYDYDYSTMSYSVAADMTPFKLSMSSHEDCGASLKELWRDEDGRTLWNTSNYFPGGGNRSGKFAQAKNLAFEDALTLALRDYDFEKQPELTLALVPFQRVNIATKLEPLEAHLRYVGKSELELPIGKVQAHELALFDAKGERIAGYWFHAQGAAPWLHVLVQWERPAQKIRARLVSQTRKAYWKRD
ncbi:MAG: hypothetical protein IPJ19_15150 [Planctomycetes bacterium]|nr:hypothetical protein [Planctomycetota bacterium]